MTLLIVGLGNPGSKYSGTRHNTGFDVVDIIASKFGVKFHKPVFKSYYVAIVKYNSNKFILIKPNTFMNRSGEVLPGLLSKYKLTNKNIVIVVDNLDINSGFLKFKLKGSDGGHNGLKSINEFIGTNDYKRLFIGIGRPMRGESITDYVLAKIDDDKVFLAEHKAADSLLKIPDEDINQIMNYVNRRKIDKESWTFFKK